MHSTEARWPGLELDGVAGDNRRCLPGSRCPLVLAGGGSFPWLEEDLQSQCSIPLRFGLRELLVEVVDRLPRRPAVLQVSLECELVIEGVAARLAVVLCWGCSQHPPGLELSEPEEFAGFEGSYWLKAR